MFNRYKKIPELVARGKVYIAFQIIGYLYSADYYFRGTTIFPIATDVSCFLGADGVVFADADFALRFVLPYSCFIVLQVL